VLSERRLSALNSAQTQSMSSVLHTT